MKKITFLIVFILTTLYSFSQFTSGEVSLTSNMSTTIETSVDEVTLTLKGPENVWFAIGFGGTNMSVSDVFTYDGTGNFDKVGHYHANPSNDTNQDWTIVSNIVESTERTIIATRSLNTSDSNDYTFINDDSTIPVIWAYGTSMTLEYHSERGFTNITRNAVANINSKNNIMFAMYPNPVQAELNIVLPSNIKNAKAELFNVLGKKILSKKLNTTFNKLDVSNLESGVYLIKIIDDDNTFGTKQFVKK